MDTKFKKMSKTQLVSLMQDIEKIVENAIENANQSSIEYGKGKINYPYNVGYLEGTIKIIKSTLNTNSGF